MEGNIKGQSGLHVRSKTFPSFQLRGISKCRQTCTKQSAHDRGSRIRETYNNKNSDHVSMMEMGWTTIMSVLLDPKTRPGHRKNMHEAGRSSPLRASAERSLHAYVQSGQSAGSAGGGLSSSQGGSLNQSISASSLATPWPKMRPEAVEAARIHLLPRSHSPTLTQPGRPIPSPSRGSAD